MHEIKLVSNEPLHGTHLEHFIKLRLQQLLFFSAKMKGDHLMEGDFQKAFKAARDVSASFPRLFWQGTPLKLAYGVTETQYGVLFPDNLYQLIRVREKPPEKELPAYYDSIPKTSVELMAAKVDQPLYFLKDRLMKQGNVDESKLDSILLGIREEMIHLVNTRIQEHPFSDPVDVELRSDQESMDEDIISEKRQEIKAIYDFYNKVGKSLSKEVHKDFCRLLFGTDKDLSSIHAGNLTKLISSDKSKNDDYVERQNYLKNSLERFGKKEWKTTLGRKDVVIDQARPTEITQTRVIYPAEYTSHQGQEHDDTYLDKINGEPIEPMGFMKIVEYDAKGRQISYDGRLPLPVQVRREE